jgi:hypothetical protein
MTKYQNTNKMKMIKKLKRTFLMASAVIAVYAFVVAGCTSCKKPDPTPPTQYSTLMMHIHTDIDTNEVKVNTPYKNADGRLISLSHARLYISNVRAIKSDGTEVSIPDTVILKTIDNEEYTIGSIPSGNYKSVKFDVGVDSKRNHMDPAVYHSTSPLSAQNPPMWFGTTANGYIFVNVDGSVDTSTAKNGKNLTPFHFQIGSDNLLKTVTMPDLAFTALPNTPAIIHLVIDYGKLFEGLDLKNHISNSTYDDPATAAGIATNIPAMFRYEML